MVKYAKTLSAMALGILVLTGCASSEKRADGSITPTDIPSPPPPLAAPPPPPAPDSSADYEVSDAVIVTGSSVGSSSPRRAAGKVGRPVAPPSASIAAAPSIAPPPPTEGTRVQQPQAGLLTAGDHDDLLNPALFARYAERYLQNHRSGTLPFVDTRGRVSVRVTTAGGKPVPFARVAFSGSNQQGGVTLITDAGGRVSAFPRLDGIGEKVTISVAGASPRVVNLSTLGTDRLVSIETTAPAKPVRAMDLLLNIDATGSMSDELVYLQTELKAIINTLNQSNPGVEIRVGLITYRDVGDEYVVRTFPFTSDISKLQSQLAAQRADGGGDYPEAVDQALAAAVNFGWREDAVKAMLFVADAPPHDDKMGTSWKQAEALRAKGIHILPVAASGVADEAEFLMRNMAASTQSRYIFLTDDSGVGNAHADPDVPCYIVTRLNNVVGRTLSGFISGARIEPKSDQIIRRVGDYDQGVCLPNRRK